jgi:hypothetical protein
MDEAVKYRRCFNALGIVAIICLSGLWGAYTIGPGRLSIFRIDWLAGDLAQVYLAWMQYISDPSAGWLTTVRNSYPLPMSISLFDPMPLLLVLLKPFAGLVPESTQYFGLYFLAGFILQGLFGYFVVQEIQRWRGSPASLSGAFISVCGGLLFASAPFTAQRLYGHTALSSQWLLVLSIWVALRTRDSGNRTWMVVNAGLVFFACGFNPYLALMVALSLAGFTFIHLGWAQWRTVAVRVGCLMLTGFIGLFAFGFMGGASVAEGGYGLYSMNMLGPFDSNAQAILLPLDVNDATGGQSNEGFNYLGLGVLLLGFLALFLQSRPALPGQRVPFINAWLIVLVAYVLALSTTLTLSVEALRIPFPQVIVDLLSRFRASGRFFWIGGFWLITLAIAVICYRFARWRVVLILGICTAVQMVDVFGVARSVRAWGVSAKSLPIPQALERAAPGHAGLVVLPPWQCDHQQTPGGDRGYEIFGVLAARNQMNINSFYAARTLPEQKSFHCDYARALTNISSDNLYVLSAKLYSENAMKFQSGFNCSELPIEGAPVLCIPANEE